MTFFLMTECLYTRILFVQKNNKLSQLPKINLSPNCFYQNNNHYLETLKKLILLAFYFSDQENQFRFKY
jgi:hypothetical protein